MAQTWCLFLESELFSSAQVLPGCSAAVTGLSHPPSEAHVGPGSTKEMRNRNGLAYVVTIPESAS